MTGTPTSFNGDSRNHIVTYNSAVLAFFIFLVLHTLSIFSKVVNEKLVLSGMSLFMSHSTSCDLFLNDNCIQLLDIIFRRSQILHLPCQLFTKNYQQIDKAICFIYSFI